MKSEASETGTPVFSPNRGEAIEDLRKEIDAIDSQLVSLLARRREVVGRIAAAKREQDMPVSHPAREENLISDRRSQAAAAGLNPDYIEDLFRAVLRNSREGQLDSSQGIGAKPGAKVLIVGGRGGMGRFFARWFTQYDYQVRILDSGDWDQAEALARDADLCLLAVPIDVTPAVAERIAPLLPRKCILADVTSLKARPMEAMLRAHPGPVMGLHPLFGPGTKTMDRQIMVVTPGRDAQKGEWLLRQLTLWGNVLVQTSPEEHDDIMGIVQALRHFATFAFGQFLHARKIPISRTLELSSPIYRLELVMVGRLFAQHPALYAEIIFASPERLAMLRDYIQSLMKNLELLERGDKAEFTRRFREVAEWFGPFGDQAMRESSYLVEQLVHRF
jgi:chorismate mutase/prephenate dehydrogenase